MKRLAAFLLCGLAGLAVQAQTGWQRVTFHFQRAAPAEHYSIEVSVGGDAWYWEGEPDLDIGKVPSTALKTIRLGTSTLDKVNGLLGLVQEGRCETHEKNIAQTGQKTLVMHMAGDGDPHTSCTFNWSDDEHINAAVNAFQAVAETLHAGDRLKHKKRFDHLGLDAELDSLIAQVKQGYATELQNIAPILQSIADDDEMLASSRRKATNLLTMAVSPGGKAVAPS